ncbi:hypothetical protein ABZ370_18360 [Streptomyces sp. NPDC005962]
MAVLVGALDQSIRERGQGVPVGQGQGAGIVEFVLGPLVFGPPA